MIVLSSATTGAARIQRPGHLVADSYRVVDHGQTLRVRHRWQTQADLREWAGDHSDDP